MAKIWTNLEKLRNNNHLKSRIASCDACILQLRHQLMERSAKMDKILASLAKSNINILGVEYSGGEPQTIVFEYQWRVSRGITKWTRGVLEWDAGVSYGENLRRVQLLAQSIRAQLEA